MAPVSPLPLSDLEDVLSRTRELWSDLRGRSIFLTGGTGFFGIWLLETLLHANRALGLDVSVTVLTRDPARFAAKAPHLANAQEVRLVRGNMRDMSAVSGRFDFAIHAATETFEDRHGQVDPELMLHGNIDGTRQFLSVVKRTGVRRFLYVSSGAAYGPQPSDVERILETHAFAPNPLLASSANGESKRCSELACALVGNGTNGCVGVIARCFSFVGPHLPLDYTYAIGNFIRDAVAGGPLRIAGDGSPVRSYLYMSDLAVSLWTLLLRGQPAQAYNVGSEEGVSIRTLAAIVRDELSPGADVLVAKAAAPGTPSSRYVPSTHKLRAAFGVDQTVTLKEAIKRTAEWHLAVHAAEPVLRS